MAGNSYLAITTPGQDPAQVQATQVSAGAADAGKIPALGTNGKLDPSLVDLSTVGAPDVESGVASEALAAGDLVNTYKNSTANGVRKAIATGYGTRATGFVLAAAVAGDTVSVYKSGATNMQVTGLTIGQQWLSDTTPGKSVAAPPTATGSVQQKVGNASSATGLHVAIGPAYGL